MSIIIEQLKEIKNIKDSVKREKEYNKFYSDSENLAPRRLFVGRTYSEKVGLFLMDKNNKPRLQIYLDESGEPHIDIIDENGNKEKIK